MGNKSSKSSYDSVVADKKLVKLIKRAHIPLQHLIEDEIYRKPTFLFKDFVNVEMELDSHTPLCDVSADPATLEMETTHDFTNALETSFPMLKGLMMSSMVIFGGAVACTLINEPTNNIDIAFYGATKELVDRAYIHALEHFLEHETSDNIGTVVIQGKEMTLVRWYDISGDEDVLQTEVRLYHRWYNTKAELLYEIDLGCCAVCYDGIEVEFSLMGKLAYQTGVIVYDYYRYNPDSYLRLAKWMSRGFELVMPLSTQRKWNKGDTEFTNRFPMKRTGSTEVKINDNYHNRIAKYPTHWLVKGESTMLPKFTTPYIVAQRQWAQYMTRCLMKAERDVEVLVSDNMRERYFDILTVSVELLPSVARELSLEEINAAFGPRYAVLIMETLGNEEKIAELVKEVVEDVTQKYEVHHKQLDIAPPEFSRGVYYRKQTTMTNIRSNNYAVYGYPLFSDTTFKIYKDIHQETEKL